MRTKGKHRRERRGRGEEISAGRGKKNAGRGESTKRYRWMGENERNGEKGR